MRILVVFQNPYADGKRVPCYAWSYVDAFKEMGHEVETCVHTSLLNPVDHPFDLVLEIENGRNEKGELPFEVATSPQPWAKTAVLFVDSHGHPDLHAVVSKGYHHVFFAVWARRDLFAGHPSAHWCPNATDLKWFGTPEQLAIEPTIDVGFFGSKRGLSRADYLVDICHANGWTYDVRQVASNRNPNRWPATGDAMARCRVLFNRGQKHDGPNQRVMESMAMGRPLLCDWDGRDGMGQLFNSGKFYLPYNTTQGIEDRLRELLLHEREREIIGSWGRGEVEAKHLIKHRAAQILEVISG